MLANPDDAVAGSRRGFLADFEFENFTDAYEQTTYSLSYAGIDAPGHAMKDLKYGPLYSVDIDEPSFGV